MSKYRIMHVKTIVGSHYEIEEEVKTGDWWPVYYEASPLRLSLLENAYSALHFLEQNGLNEIREEVI